MRNYREAGLMRFEWDDETARINEHKHHVSFETAREVFADPLHRSIQDHVEDGEQRWNTVGLVAC